MLDYRHLYCFRVVAKEGGFARAVERLDMAIQSISAQVRKLDKALGHRLRKHCDDLEVEIDATRSHHRLARVLPRPDAGPSCGRNRRAISRAPALRV